MFCEYCGRQLLKGEKCTCSGAVKAREGKNVSGEEYRSTYSDGFGYGGTAQGTPDIDLSESDYTGTTDASDNLCNHNGTYFHQQSGWTSANNTQQSTPPSSYVYADVPQKKKAGGLGIGLTLLVVLICFVVPIAGIFFTLRSSERGSSYESDYIYNNETEAIYDSPYTTASDFDYELGSIENDFYINSWSNISFNMPRRYIEADSSEYEEYETSEEDCAFLAYKDDNCGSIVISSSNQSWLKHYDTEELLDAITDNFISNLDEYEYEYEVGDTYDREIADATYLCIDIDLFDYGYMTIAIHRIDYGYTYFTIIENSQSRIDRILDSVISAY